MKKLLPILFLCAIICMNSIVTKAQSPRVQLFEYFDNTSIPTYINNGANAMFDSLMDVNADKAVFIKYHVAWGAETGTDPMNLDNEVQVDQRVTYYGVTGDPNAIQEGGVVADATFNGQPLSLNQSFIDDRNFIQSPFTISVSFTLNDANDTINTHTVITKTGDVTDGELVARVVVIEKLVKFTPAPGISGDTTFRNVMKEMLPPTGTLHGTLLPAMAIGDSFVLDLPWHLENVYDISQLGVISFVQEKTSHEVYQSGQDGLLIGTGIATNNPLNDIDVFPNPSTGNISIQLNSIITNGTLNVISIEGQKMMAINNMNGNNFSLDISSLSKGIYFLQINNEENNTFGIRKIILQ